MARSGEVLLVRRRYSHSFYQGNGSRRGGYPIGDALAACSKIHLLKINVELRGSPYMLKDRRRAYLAQERDAWRDALLQSGLGDRLIVIEQGGKSTLLNHFQILDTFWNSERGSTD